MPKENLREKNIEVHSNQYYTNGIVYVKNKEYVLEFVYHEKKYMEILCPINKEATLFIQSIATWRMEEIISEIEMRESYELCVKAKR